MLWPYYIRGWEGGETVVSGAVIKNTHNGRFETSVSRVKSVTLKLSFKYLSGLVEQHTGLSSQNNKRRGAPERASGPLYGKEGLAAGLHPPEELD